MLTVKPENFKKKKKNTKAIYLESPNCGHGIRKIRRNIEIAKKIREPQL